MVEVVSIGRLTAFYAIFSYFWTNLRPILVQVIFKLTIRPKIGKIGFFNFRPKLSSLVRQLQYNTDLCRTEEIRPGCFSIRLTFSQNKHSRTAFSV